MTFWARLSGLWNNLLSQCSSDPLERCQWIKFPAVRQSRAETAKDQLARLGEEAAAQYLISKGYKILHRNIRFAEGELDLIARQENTLVFLEVKTRETAYYGEPFQFVSVKKQHRQVAMAHRFISLCRIGSIPVRFDIVSVVIQPHQPPQIEHIEHAFVIQDL